MQSMTGFGRGSFYIAQRLHYIEIRTVNNRFLDIKIRLPWVEPAIESRLVERIRSLLSRGRVEVVIRNDNGADSFGELRLNKAVAKDLKRVISELTGILNCDQSTAVRLLPPIHELLVSGEDGYNSDEIWGALDIGLTAALKELVDMRHREGEALQKDLIKQLRMLTEICAKIKTLTCDEPELQRNRLSQRIKQLAGDADLDPQRLIQEVAIIADRSDVNEELARLDSHIAQTYDLLNDGGDAGRKLEFMLQEINRELNTVAAKTINSEISSLVVEAKACSERMREQAHNVE